MSRMNMTLFQVGDLVVNQLTHQRWPEHANKYDLKATRIPNSHQVIFGQDKFNPEPRNYKIEGIPMPSNCLSEAEFLNRLQQVAGFETDLFAYQILMCCNDSPNCSCASKETCKLAWFHARGGITDVVIGEERAGVTKVSFTVVVEPYWTAVDRLMFRFTDARPSQFYNEVIPFCDCSQMINFMPSCDEVFNPSNCNGFMWVKVNYCDPYISYYGDLFDVFFGNLPPNYWAIPGFSRGYHVPVSSPTAIHQSMSVFSAPPQSVYLFSGLPRFGQAKIWVNAADVWDDKVQETIIDMAATHNVLVENGYGGLLVSDVLVIGDLPDLPGRILRISGGVPTVLSGVFPVVDYPGLWPGQLGNRGNLFRIVVPGQTQVAYKHIFRRT